VENYVGPLLASSAVSKYRMTETKDVKRSVALDAKPDGYRMMRTLDQPSVVIQPTDFTEEKEAEKEKSPEELGAFRALRIRAATERRQNSMTVGGGSSGGRAGAQKKMGPPAGAAPPAPRAWQNTDDDASDSDTSDEDAPSRPLAPVNGAWPGSFGDTPFGNSSMFAGSSNGPLDRVKESVVQVFEKNQNGVFDPDFLVFAGKLFSLG
jgi:hypothetical protein